MDSELEQLLYPPPPSAGTPRPEPDFVTIDLELRRKGVTLELLHQEYLALHPEGYLAPPSARTTSRGKRRVA